MSNASKLLIAYERLMAAEEEKHRLLPERLVTMVADKSWIKAVSQHSEARQSFVEAAIDFCRTEKHKGLRIPRKAPRKQALGQANQEISLS
ncbi:hypothetical protein [Microvirga guangxiensis]|uniref:Uncharacterized protein n=1 Tax=Microvirga guangxiensis TaxID=549386 RepID=A0A1G5IXD5_9HYPH|nr:hypothetical protein [Microvirga guangxiensis]SCY80743.1 hypothetical protein SAMN02927923_02373 [Microvirga guangxiensis]